MHTLIGKIGQKPMFYCTGKLVLPDMAVLCSTMHKDIELLKVSLLFFHEKNAILYFCII